MNTNNKTEHELYKKMWNTGYRKSQCAIPFISLLMKEIKHGERSLEIGSGDGTTMNGLIKERHDVTGSDVYSMNQSIIEFPAWDIPFQDNHFDVTFSTDVLEHIPTEMVKPSIIEILRVTKRKSIHVIACWEDMKDGEVLHKTVMKIPMWIELFNSINQGKELMIIDRDDFI